MTDFDHLGDVWRRRAPNLPGQDEAAALDAARQRAEYLQRAVRRRDWIETLAAFAMVPVFVWAALTAPSLVSAAGAWIVVVACVLIPVRLWVARQGAADPSLPVSQAVAAELARIRAQERLLGSVAWWYFTPLGLGVVLFIAGGPAPVAFKVVYGVVVAVLYAYGVRLNGQAVRRQFEPVARELEHWLAHFNEASLDGASDAS